MDIRRLRHLASQGLLAGFAAVCGLTCLSLSSLSARAQNMQRLPHTIPALVAQANLIGNVPGTQPVALALALPLRHAAQLDALLTHLYAPNDPLYGLYLTSEQFNANYAPTQADYNAIISYAKTRGLTVTATHANRLLLEVSGTAQTVQTAFNLHLKNYKLPSGRVFRAPDADPSVPAPIANRLQTIIGFDTTTVRKPYHHITPRDPLAFLNTFLVSRPGGGLIPSDIKTAYNLNGTTLNGSGQTLALYELDGYAPDDIKFYEDQYGLPHVPLVNSAVGGFSGVLGGGAIEVTLDIEMMAALAPGAKQISVYEAPNTSVGSLAIFNRIAEDNTAQIVSISWGGPEEVGVSVSESALEGQIFKQMAAQGQSVFSASGDSGAYNLGATGTVLSVNDPPSQPYVTGVGGTKMQTNGQGGTWQSETTWAYGPAQSGLVWDPRANPLFPNPVGGGGGISILWRIPKYQSKLGVLSQASNASHIWRNVPDVALNADGNTGYSIYFSGRASTTGIPVPEDWVVGGGTSFAAPLWAAFTALVNQQRQQNQLPPLGFANPAIYSIGLDPAKYLNDFHDISDGGDNLYTNYKAVTGYDLTTGWGTFNGVNLLNDLATYGTPPPPPPPVAGQLLGNPGFENGASAPRPWFTTAGVIDNSSAEPSHGGAWKAWLGGYPTPRQDILLQQVTLPGNITSATLSFYLHIDTAKSNSPTVHDTLAVQVRSNSNTVLGTLGTFTNLNAASGFTQQTFDMSAYKGQTVQLYLVSFVDGKIATSFVVDDFALNVQ